MDIQWTSAEQALHSVSLHACKASDHLVEETCMRMCADEHCFGRCTPNSVLATLPRLPYHLLDRRRSSPPPSLDHVESLAFCTSFMCSKGYNDREEHYMDEDSHQKPHTQVSLLGPPLQMRIPWPESGAPVVEDDAPMLDNEAPLSATCDTSNVEQLDALMSGCHEDQIRSNHARLGFCIPKQHVVQAVSPCRVATTLSQQHVKEVLEQVLQKELAICGCKRVIIENDAEDGRNPSQDHQLECSQRTDYATWVRKVQKQSIQSKGLELVQRLLACAEAVACKDGRQARVLLEGVQELASPYGDSLQRVAFCFKEGLAARTLQQYNFAGPTPANQSVPIPSTVENAVESRNQACIFARGNASEEVLSRQQEAFRFMCEVCPYVPFGHFVANSVIMEAVEGEEMVHVIDLGMTEATQWLRLIQSLATRRGGLPKLLRITGVGNSASKLEESGDLLHQEATAVSLNFEFKGIHQPLEHIAKAELDLRGGETVVVNSVLSLHCVVKENRVSLNTVLHAIHDFSPKVLTLVEQDSNHNGPFFLCRFMEALHYYSAIFDSLQAALPRNSTQRVNIEQCHLAFEIGNIVACEGLARVERHERMDQWRRRMSRAGFQLAPIRLEGQAYEWLTRNYTTQMDDYTLSDEKGCLLLGWKGKPIIAASAWRCSEHS